MFFSIDPSGDVPIYEQIVRQVKLAVADGVLVEVDAGCGAVAEGVLVEVDAG